MKFQILHYWGSGFEGVVIAPETDGDNYAYPDDYLPDNKKLEGWQTIDCDCDGIWNNIPANEVFEKVE